MNTLLYDILNLLPALTFLFLLRRSY